MIVLRAGLAVFFLFACRAVCSAAQANDTPTPERLVGGAVKAAAELTLYSCTFVKRERKQDGLSAELAYKVDFKKAPRSIIWKHLSGPGPRRTVLHNGKVAPDHIFTDPFLPFLGPIRVSVSSPFVQRECGRSLLGFGMETFALRLREAFESTRDTPGYRWRVMGRTQVGGRRYAPAWILRQEKPRDALVDWFIDVETGRAVKVFVLGENGALVEEYLFADIAGREFANDHFEPSRLWGAAGGKNQ